MSLYYLWVAESRRYIPCLVIKDPNGKIKYIEVK